MHYGIAADEKMVSYYEVIVTDFTGCREKKSPTSIVFSASFIPVLIEVFMNRRIFKNRGRAY